MDYISAPVLDISTQSAQRFAFPHPGLFYNLECRTIMQAASRHPVIESFRIESRSELGLNLQNGNRLWSLCRVLAAFPAPQAPGRMQRPASASIICLASNLERERLRSIRSHRGAGRPELPPPANRPHSRNTAWLHSNGCSGNKERIPDNAISTYADAGKTAERMPR